MKAIIPQDNPPRGHELGGIEPTVNSLADLETAVETIAHLDSRRRTVLACFEQSLALIQDHRDRELVIDIGGQPVTLDDREAALRQAVADYVTDHRDTVFPDGTQTRHFARGTVSLRKSRPRIDFTSGATKTTVTNSLVKKFELLKKLTDYARRIKIVPFLKLKAELDVTAVKKAVELGDVKRAELVKLGLSYVDDEETVDVKTIDAAGRSTTVDELTR